MKTVWKYPLAMSPYQTLNLPLAAIERVVLVDIDPATQAPAIWCEVDPDSTLTRSVSFGVFGTGHDIPPNWIHVGSCVTPGGIFVWHVYRERVL